MRTYEAMLIFLTSLEEADVEKTLDRIAAEISRHGGSVQGANCMGRRTFARPMKKQDTGTYYKLAFTLMPDQIDALKARLKLIDELFRVGISRIEIKVEAPVPEAETETAAPEAAAVETAPEAAPAPVKKEEDNG